MNCLAVLRAHAPSFPIKLYGIGLALLAIPLHSQVFSEFEDSDEGWLVIELADTFGAGPYEQVVRGPYRPAYAPSGGNPGGALLQVDTPGNSFFFQAPSEFLGDQVAALDGQLHYQLASAPPPPGNWYVEADVILTGSNGMVLATQAVESPPASWRQYSVTMVESAWHKGSLVGPSPSRDELRTVLSALQRLWIRGEHFYGTDSTYLDNVRWQYFSPPILTMELTDSVRITATTIPGIKYVVETSTNLSQWESLTLFRAAAATSTHITPYDATGSRYYRIRPE